VSRFDPFQQRRFDRFEDRFERRFPFREFDPLEDRLERRFGFDPFLRRRFSFDPFFGTPIFSFPSSRVMPFAFVSPNGF
jgi:hypothetical protein